MKQATLRSILLAMAFSAFCVPLLADEAGMAIARRIDALEPQGAAQSRFEMTVYPGGGGAARGFVVLSWEREDGASLTSFEEPRTIRGLRILTKGADSWVYFPSTGRVRKIAGDSRSGSVQGVGGDFSYEDLGAGAWADGYEFTLSAEDDSSWTIEGRAGSSAAAYEVVRINVAKADGRPIRITFYSSSEGGWYKELSFFEYRDFNGETRAARLEMRNLNTGSRTVVRLLEAQYGVTLEGRLFDPARFDK